MKRQPAANAPAAQASLPCISFGPLLLTFCILISHNLVFSKIEWFPDKKSGKRQSGIEREQTVFAGSISLMLRAETRRQNTPSRYEIGSTRMLPNIGKHTEPGQNVISAQPMTDTASTMTTVSTMPRTNMYRGLRP